MERPIYKPVGTLVEELDTPALVVDLSVLEQNIETMHSFFRERDAKLRPHVEAHRCPAIAHRQLAAGGTVGGICVTTVGQAEVFAENGFADIFIANLVVTPPKITRLCALARRAKMTVAVDNPQNVKELSEAAAASGVCVDVVVDINTRLGRCGVEPGRPALDLSRVIAEADSLDFAGLMTYEGTILGQRAGDAARGGRNERQTLGWVASGDSMEEPGLGENGDSSIESYAADVAAESREWIQKVLDTREMVEKAGIDVKTVSVGGTYNYEIAGAIDGVTEVPAGSYALMDERYRQHRTQFEPAARVMATVTSVPEEGVAITDGGGKAIGSDAGPPSVDNVLGSRSLSLSAEHGTLALDTSLEVRLNLGDKVWYTPWDVGECVNLHDYMNVVRDAKLEAVWGVPARGHYR